MVITHVNILLVLYFYELNLDNYYLYFGKSRSIWFVFNYKPWKPTALSFGHNKYNVHISWAHSTFFTHLNYYLRLDSLYSIFDEQFSFTRKILKYLLNTDLSQCDLNLFIIFLTIYVDQKTWLVQKPQRMINSGSIFKIFKWIK